MRKYLPIFLFFFLFATADFIVTFINVLPDASNEANLLAAYVIQSYGKNGFIISGLIYAAMFGIVCALIKLPTYPYFNFEKRHPNFILNFRNFGIIAALALVIFAGANHFSACLTWFFAHYSIITWFDYVRMTALSAPLAFLIGIYFGRQK